MFEEHLEPPLERSEKVSKKEAMRGAPGRKLKDYANIRNAALETGEAVSKSTPKLRVPAKSFGELLRQKRKTCEPPVRRSQER